MKERTLTVVVLLLGLLGPASRGIGPQDVLLYAPFDGAVRLAQGSGEAAPKGELRFVPGKRGQALVVGGTAGTAVSYPTAGNLRRERGTLSLWVCPVDWKWGDGRHHMFLSLPGQPTALLYTYISLPTYFLQLTPDNRNPHVGTEVQWAPGEWHHLAVSWQEGDVRLYVDGQLKSQDSETMSLPTVLGESIVVGGGPFGTQDQTLVDEVLICGRALLPAEVEALYRFSADNPAADQGVVPVLGGQPAITAALRHFPGAGRVEVAVRATGAVGDAGKPVQVSAQVVAADGQAQGEVQAATLEVGVPAVLQFPVGSLPAGTWRVRLQAAPAGAAAETVEVAFERRSAPEWAGNRLGLDDSTPAPWSPVEVIAAPEATAVRVWGREYRLAGLDVAQVLTQGVPLLAGPMGLRLQVEGRPQAASDMTLRLAERLGEGVVLKASGRLGELRVNATVRLEFDGFVWQEIEVIPPAGGAQVQALTYDMPYLAAQATLFYSGVYYPALDNGTGTLGPGGFKGAWRNWFWVGEERGGIEWFAEDRRSWILNRPQEALSITPGAGQTLVRLNLIDQPTRLERPLRLAFGIQATPVKPKREDGRRWRVIGFQPEGGAGKVYMLPANQRVRGATLWNEGWTSVWMVPRPRPDAKASIARLEEQGIRPCMYLAQNTLDPRDEQFHYFWEDWRRTPGPPYSPAWPEEKGYYLETAICPASGYQDYFIWLLERAVRECDLRGLYFDNSVPTDCDNPAHGCGLNQADGSRAGRTPLLAARQWYKRVYRLLKAHDPSAIVAIHMSGYPLVPLQSFADIIIDGENFTGYMQVQKTQQGWDNYWHTLPLDVMRAQYRNHWGPETAFLPEFGRALGPQWNNGDEAQVRAGVEHLIGLFFIHDSGLWPAWSTLEPYDRFFQAQDRFGWDEQTRFVPYWDLQGLAAIATDADLGAARPAAEAARPGNPALALSLYCRPGRALFVPFNNTDQDLSVTLTWDAAKLGLGSFAELEDSLRGTRVQAAVGRASLLVPKRNFGMWTGRSAEP